MTFARNGASFDYVCTGEVKRGDVIVVNDLLGIAAVNGEAGKTIAVYAIGVHRLPKGAAELAQGKTVYWDATNKQATTTASNNTKLGVVWETAAAADGVVQVKIG